MRKTQKPTVDEHGYDEHPAWGMINAHRVTSTPGAVMFDSDIRHQHYVTVKISTGARKRDLHRDWAHARKEIIEIAMSEAQWAAFVSTMNAGSGVPCTILSHGHENVPGMPYEPRLQESLNEVRNAADRAAEAVSEAFAAYEEKKTVANLRTLKYAIANMPANVEYAGQTLNEHAENVVQKARADIEAMVVTKAQQMGLESGDLGITAQLTEGS